MISKAFYFLLVFKQFYQLSKPKGKGSGRSHIKEIREKNIPFYQSSCTPLPSFSSLLKNKLKPLSLWCLILKRIHHSQPREKMTKNLPRQFHLQGSFTRLIYSKTKNKNKMNTQQAILILRASFDMMISYLQLCNLYNCHQRKVNAFQNHLDSA